jgi:hypothetical protein
MEESITRAEVDFIADHFNIALYVQHHCCGQLILRPPATYSDEEFVHKGDLELYKLASARSLEHSGWYLASSVYDWVKDSFESAIYDPGYPPNERNDKPTQTYRDEEGKLRNTPRGMVPNESQGDYAYFAWGSSLETMYELFGIFSFSDEHWRIPDYDGNGKVSDEERLKWNDEEMEGKIFVDWHPFDHPTLGEIEIGGWRVENQMEKVCPPEGDLVQLECERGTRFVTYLATLAPTVEIRVGDIKILNDEAGISQVDITVKNTGFLQTATEKAQALKIVKPVLLKVEPNDNLELLFGERIVELGHIDGGSESRKTSFLVRKKDDSRKAVLKVVVTSQRAGSDSKEIVIQ